MHFGKPLEAALIAAWAAIGCVQIDGQDDDGHDHDTEVISRVELRFTPSDGGDGGDPIVAAFSDPDGDGGVSGESEPIALALGVEYTLSIALLNDLEDPPVDIGAEIEEEAEEHMVFITDDAGLLSHAYADLESDYGADAIGDDLPVGLVHTVAADVAGAGNFRVVLRHLPELNGSPQKTAGLEQRFADGEALPGDVDVDVSFALTVQ